MKASEGRDKSGGSDWRVLASEREVCPEGTCGTEGQPSLRGCALRALNPGVETPYSRLSLRDGELACSIATTIMVRKIKACPQNPLLSRVPESEKALEPGAWARKARRVTNVKPP